MTCVTLSHWSFSASTSSPIIGNIHLTSPVGIRNEINMYEVTRYRILSLNAGAFFFFFCCTCRMWTFPGQGSNLSHLCDLYHSCSNASLTFCARLLETEPLQRQSQILNLVSHSRNSETLAFRTSNLSEFLVELKNYHCSRL